MQHQDEQWIECNIHDEKIMKKNKNKSNYQEIEHDEIDQVDDDEEDKTFLFQLFDTQNKDKDNFDTFEYEITIPSTLKVSVKKEEKEVESKLLIEEEPNSKNTKTKIIKLRGHAEINNSTGLSIWLGSELLSQYITLHHDLLYNKNVLELGSGLGLCGIVSYLVCGAKSVCLTDGDVNVLHNLRYNVEMNIQKEDEVHVGLLGMEDKDRPINEVQVVLNEDSIRKNPISCPQLIWGKNLDQFQRQYGKPNVILAADCIYMTQSVEPLWQTISELLSTDDDAVVIYTNRSSSDARAPLEMILDVADKYGFKNWKKSKLEGKSCGIGDDSILSGEVYEFRRA